MNVTIVKVSKIKSFHIRLVVMSLSFVVQFPVEVVDYGQTKTLHIMYQDISKSKPPSDPHAYAYRTETP